MKRPLRVLFCLVHPLHPDNILFLAKQRRKRVAGMALRAYLRRQGVDSVAGIASCNEGNDRLPEPVVQALGCLGYIRLCSELKGTVKADSEIDTGQGVSGKYPPDRAVAEDRLHDALKGRSIAVVGPSKGGDSSEEIDEYDVVVRVGYSGKESLPQGTGERCDIAFYAPHKMRKLLQTQKRQVLQSLQLVVVFKTDRYFNHQLTLDDIPVAPERLVEVPLPVFPQTKPNTLVKVLYNCLRAGPSHVKVFNADLFLSASYPAGYIGNNSVVAGNDSWSQEAKGLCRSFAVNHDPGEQLEFYKYFYFRGAFEADPVLNEVLQMEASEYLDQLDQRYGMAVRRAAGLEARPDNGGSE